jgi:hypothetical protein
VNKKQYVDAQLRDMYGLHPFERLCEQCQLPDCMSHRIECLQHKVLGYAPVNAMSWKKMTEVMMEAGVTSELGDLPKLFGLEVEDEQRSDTNVVRGEDKGDRRRRAVGHQAGHAQRHAVGRG